MKLATLKDGSRDGQLAVVSRDLTTAHFASHIATTLRQVLDDWNFISPQLEDLTATLNGGKARHAFPFDPRQCMAPLPRGFLRLAASADGLSLAEAASDDFLGPCDDLRALAAAAAAAGVGAGEGAAAGADAPAPEDPADALCQPALASITGDVAQGTDAAGALEGVRLLMLVADWLLPGDVRACACGPVVLTPDELGDAWHDGCAHLRLHAAVRGQSSSQQPALDDTGNAMQASLGALLSTAAATRRLRAGSIVCVPLAGTALPLHLQPGGTLHLELLTRDGSSAFGAIAQALALQPD